MLYRRLLSVISHHRLSLLLYCACVCGMSRISRSPRKIIIWIFGNTVKCSRCPILDLMASVRASSSPCRFIFFQFFFQLFFLYHVQVCNPDTTDRRHHAGSAGCVLQPAGYNTIHACRLPAEQAAPPHARDSLSVLYYCGFLVAFVIGPCDL